MFNVVACTLLSLAAAATPADSRSPYELVRFSRHSFTINSVNVTKTGHAITSGGDETVFSWHLDNGQVESEKEIEWAERIRSAVSPDGNVVVSVDEGPEVSIWLRGKPSATIARTDSQEWVECVAFAPDGSLLATGDTDGTVILWESSKIYTNNQMTVGSSDKRRTLKTSGEVENLEFSPDSRLLATISESEDATEFDIWRASTGQRLRGAVVDGLALAFAPDGKSILAGKTIFDASTLKPIAQLHSIHPLHAAAFEPLGRYVATAGEDNRLVFWDPRTGEQLAAVRVHDYAVTCLAFTPDGDRIVTGSRDATARVWDAKKILAERPHQELMSKMASQPHAFDVWRLGFCYSRALLGMNAKQPMRKEFAEAESRAKALGIELPAKPTEEQLSNRGELLESRLELLRGEVDKRFGKTQASLLQLAGALPMLRIVYDPTNESMRSFGKETLCHIGEEIEKEFGAAPSMFETFNARVLGATKKSKMEDAFDLLIREITLALEAQRPSRTTGTPTLAD